MDYFAVLSSAHKRELWEAIDQDLSRFMPAEILSVHRKEGYAAFLESVRSLFSDLKKKGVRLP
ncbi:MAG: hypothetical protein L7F78_27835, partial [Syntrophales bacterium LBB04]|nr:hypothetical protein [Syntrophales bacterium LBB04]